MGQAEIQKILMSDKDKWFSTIEIQKILNQKASVVTRALRKMEQYKEVRRRKFMVKQTNTHYPLCFWKIK